MFRIAVIITDIIGNDYELFSRNDSSAKCSGYSLKDGKIRDFNLGEVRINYKFV